MSNCATKAVNVFWVERSIAGKITSTLTRGPTYSSQVRTNIANAICVVLDSDETVNKASCDTGGESGEEREAQCWDTVEKANDSTKEE